MGAAVEIQSGGRVAKYKHCLYEWLGVDKVELAVLAELLLRGAQTVGELRGRAARMEPIADLAALQPVLQSLRQKQLLIDLTPPGRGQVVTHGLCDDAEINHLRQEHGGGHPSVHSPSATPTASPSSSQLRELSEQVAQLAARVEQLETRMRALE
jgi:uncharacterized protein YceH (UPF0502 family)